VDRAGRLVGVLNLVFAWLQLQGYAVDTYQAI
jgi:hypothetical protein